MLEKVVNDIFTTEITQTGAFFRLLLSLVLGCMIGYERRRKGQMAGVRTFALIAMGANLAIILSIYVAATYFHLNGDPTRIAAQVVSGVGFLGAGAIIQMRGSVRGLTTAASIWVTAAVGMVVGVGMYALAVLATFSVLFVLSWLESYEQKVNFAWSSKVVRVHLRGIVVSSQPYIETFELFHMQVNDTYLKFDYKDDCTIANYVVLTRAGTDFSELFEKLGSIRETLSITLTNEINN